MRIRKWALLYVVVLFLGMLLLVKRLKINSSKLQVKKACSEIRSQQQCPRKKRFVRYPHTLSRTLSLSSFELKHFSRATHKSCKFRNDINYNEKYLPLQIRINDWWTKQTICNFCVTKLCCDEQWCCSSLNHFNRSTFGAENIFKTKQHKILCCFCSKTRRASTHTAPTPPPHHHHSLFLPLRLSMLNRRARRGSFFSKRSQKNPRKSRASSYILLKIQINLWGSIQTRNDFCVAIPWGDVQWSFSVLHNS